MDNYNLDNLKIEHNKSEIVSTLIRMYREGTPVLVWQNSSDHKKIMKNSIIEGIFPDLGYFTLSPLLDADFFDFNNTSTVYIRGNERSILFKQPKLVLKDNRIIVQIPDQVRMYEKRYSKRYHFGLKSKHHVEVFHTKNSLTASELFEFTLFDVSDRGASFNVSLRDEKYFYQEEMIKLVKLGDKYFSKYLRARIIYLHKMNNKIAGLLCPSIKMGIKFERELTPRELSEIKDFHMK